MPIPILLYTYLAAEVLAPTIGAFIILNCILLLGKIIPLLDTILAFGVGITDFIRLCAYIAPQLFLFTIPMAFMMGTIIGITRLGSDGEIMILKSSGVGLYKTLPPIVVIALMAAIATGLFSVRLIPAGNIALHKLMFQLAKEKIDKGLREKHFSDVIGDVVFYADQIDRTTGLWRGVYMTDLRDSMNPIIIMAQSGQLSTDHKNMSLSLALRNGSLHRTQGNITQHIDFDKYSLHLALPTPASGASPAADRRSLSLRQLQEQAELLGPNKEPGISFLIELHQRLSLPVGCFILTLLGLPLGFLAGPGRRSMGLPIGLGIFIAYYILLTAAKALSESLVLPVAPAMWGPNILFFPIMIYLLHSTAAETTGLHCKRIGVFLRKPHKDRRDEEREWSP
jgi:lipopolysaccharide export system permease protein